MRLPTSLAILAIKVKAAVSKDLRGEFDARLREIERFEGLEIRAGILANEGAETHSEGLTVLDVASFHEFGTRRIPARSFLRGYYDERESDLDEGLDRMLASVVAGKRTAQSAGDAFGSAVVAGIQKRISDRIEPALADATIARKGSDVPLIDTGQLRSSITYDLRWKT